MELVPPTEHGGFPLHLTSAYRKSITNPVLCIMGQIWPALLLAWQTRANETVVRFLTPVKSTVKALDW